MYNPINEPWRGVFSRDTSQLCLPFSLVSHIIIIIVYCSCRYLAQDAAVDIMKVTSLNTWQTTVIRERRSCVSCVTRSFSTWRSTQSSIRPAISFNVLNVQKNSHKNVPYSDMSGMDMIFCYFFISFLSSFLFCSYFFSSFSSIFLLSFFCSALLYSVFPIP